MRSRPALLQSASPALFPVATLLALLVILSSRAGAQASPPQFIVNTTADDSPTPSNCTTLGGTCTLRDALAAAAAAGSGSISFAKAVFPGTAPSPVIQTLSALVIPSNTTITAPAPVASAPQQTVSVESGYFDAVFRINAGTTNAAFSGLFLTQGPPSYAGASNGVISGGSLTITNSAIAAFGGGLDPGSAIFNDQAGTLTLIHTTLYGNQSGEENGYTDGGALYNAGSATLINSDISLNGGRYTSGGGIYNVGTLSLLNTTVHNNSISDGGKGGGVLNSGTLSITSSSITGNAAPVFGYGSGIFNQGILTLTNSIVADNKTNQIDNPSRRPRKTTAMAPDALRTPPPATSSARASPLPSPAAPPSAPVCSAISPRAPPLTTAASHAPPATAPAPASTPAPSRRTTPSALSPSPLGGPGRHQLHRIRAAQRERHTLCRSRHFHSARASPLGRRHAHRQHRKHRHPWPRNLQLAARKHCEPGRYPACYPPRHHQPGPPPLTGPATVAATSRSFDVTATTPPSAPVFSLPAGTYSGPQTLTLTDTTTGAVIYYTLNGATPTVNSTPYTALIQISSSETVKAIAVLDGLSSSVATSTYTIQSTSCVTIDYSRGFTPGALTLNGGATLNSSALELTDGGTSEARSAFFSTLVPATTFKTDFTFQLLNPQADGFTFTIQSSGPSALGAGGGGLGYSGIPASAALKFDLYNNKGEGTDSTGLFLNGAYPDIPSTNLRPAGIDLHSGHIFALHLAYANSKANATITDTVTGASASASATGDISSLVGNSAYVGFTAGTGALTSTTNILTWTFEGGPACN